MSKSSESLRLAHGAAEARATVTRSAVSVRSWLNLAPAEPVRAEESGRRPRALPAFVQYLCPVPMSRTYRRQESARL